MTDKKPTLVAIRHILSDLGLISEPDFQNITGATDETLKSWRKQGKYFPSIRLGNNYFYPIALAKKVVDEMTAEKSVKSENPGVFL